MTWTVVNLNDTVKLGDPENLLSGVIIILDISLIHIADFAFKYQQLVTMATRVGQEQI